MNRGRIQSQKSLLDQLEELRDTTADTDIVEVVNTYINGPKMHVDSRNKIMHAMTLANELGLYDAADALLRYENSIYFRGNS